jgi:ABC-2 type transport system permease protein
MNPIRVWSVFDVNLKGFIRDKGGLFFTFLFPIMLMLLFGFIFSDSGETEYPITIQDLDDSPLSNNLTSMLKEVKSFQTETLGTKRDPKAYIENNDANFVIVIPEGYGKAMEERFSGNLNSTGNITVYYDESQSSTQVKMSILNGILQEMNKEMGGVQDSLVLSAESIFSEDFTYIDFFIPGVLGLTVMTGAVFGTIFGDTENRQKGIFRKLSTTPITRGEWILATMLFQLFSAALSAVVILTVGFIVFNATFYMNPVTVLILVLEAFFFTGLAMLLVRFIKEAQSASALGNVITFPMMFLSGTFFNVEGMPPFLQVIAKALPLYYVNEGLRDAMIFNDYGAALYNTAIIGVLAVVVFIAGVFLTTWRQD